LGEEIWTHVHLWAVHAGSELDDGACASISERAEGRMQFALRNYLRPAKTSPITGSLSDARTHRYSSGTLGRGRDCDGLRTTECAD